KHLLRTRLPEPRCRQFQELFLVLDCHSVNSVPQWPPDRTVTFRSFVESVDGRFVCLCAQSVRRMLEQRQEHAIVGMSHPPHDKIGGGSLPHASNPLNDSFRWVLPRAPQRFGVGGGEVVPERVLGTVGHG